MKRREAKCVLVECQHSFGEPGVVVDGVPCGTLLCKGDLLIVSIKRNERCKVWPDGKWIHIQHNAVVLDEESTAHRSIASFAGIVKKLLALGKRCMLRMSPQNSEFSAEYRIDEWWHGVTFMYENGRYYGLAPSCQVEVVLRASRGGLQLMPTVGETDLKTLCDNAVVSWYRNATFLSDIGVIGKKFCAMSVCNATLQLVRLSASLSSYVCVWLVEWLPLVAEVLTQRQILRIVERVRTSVANVYERRASGQMKGVV